METLQTVHDTFWGEPGGNIALLFLMNSDGWRGTVAHKIKRELRAIVKHWHKITGAKYL